MAEGLNRVTILGNLGEDPQFRTTAGGGVLKLRVACTERYKDTKENAWKERTEWISVAIFGKRGEALAAILTKGASVLVEGSLRTSSYEKNGEKRYSTEVVAQNIILTGGKRDAGGQASTPRERPAPAAPSGGGSSDDFNYGGSDGGDDIPF